MLELAPHHRLSNLKKISGSGSEKLILYYHVFGDSDLGMPTL
jgi:hypothetical protein